MDAREVVLGVLTGEAGAASAGLHWTVIWDRALRDGYARPVPQRNAPVGASMPSGLPRNS